MNKAMLVVFAMLLSVPLQSKADPNFPPNLSEGAKTAYLESYEPAARDKAFAITKDGQHFTYVYGRSTSSRAARIASWRCLDAYGVLCMVWMVNGDDVLPAYEKAAEDSAKAIAGLPADFPDRAYAWENTNTNVSAPKTLRDGAQVHSPTPVTAPSGAKTISTQELVKLYRAEAGLVVLDVLSDNAVTKKTLPNASWFQGGGWSQSGKNADIEEKFAKAMEGIAPKKDTPIVAYCLDSECWLSWNASMRLVAMGYKRVYWYRGGVEAWIQAGLPLVDTPLTAQLW